MIGDQLLLAQLFACLVLLGQALQMVFLRRECRPAERMVYSLLTVLVLCSQILGRVVVVVVVVQLRDPRAALHLLS